MRLRHFLPLFTCAAIASFFSSTASASEQGSRCGFNPLTHRRICNHEHSVAGRGLNDVGPDFALWLNQANVFKQQRGDNTNLEHRTYAAKKFRST